MSRPREGASREGESRVTSDSDSHSTTVKSTSSTRHTMSVSTVCWGLVVFSIDFLLAAVLVMG